MENAITAALSKQIVLTRAMETTANNIANQTTAGFKAERVAFREYIARLDDAAANDTDVSLVFDPDSYTDFARGGLEPTFSPFDFAIDGDGFFAVETTAGLRYTRDGHFTVSAFGELVTRDGDRVLDSSNAPILIDPEAGDIVVTSDGLLQQEGVPIAKIGVFVFDDTAVLEKRGGNLFAADAEPREVALPRIRQGFIETSNVAPITAVTDLIEIMRAYEQAARVLETSNELSQRTVQTLSEDA